MTSFVGLGQPSAEDIADGQISAEDLIENLYTVADVMAIYGGDRITFVSAFTAGMLLGSQRPEQIRAFFEEIAPSDTNGVLGVYQDIVDKVYSK